MRESIGSVPFRDDMRAGRPASAPTRIERSRRPPNGSAWLAFIGIIVTEACPSGPKSTPKAPTAAATALLSKKIEAVKFLIDDFADTTLLCSVPSAALKRFRTRRGTASIGIRGNSYGACVTQLGLALSGMAFRARVYEPLSVRKFNLGNADFEPPAGETSHPKETVDNSTDNLWGIICSRMVLLSFYLKGIGRRSLRRRCLPGGSFPTRWSVRMDYADVGGEFKTFVVRHNSEPVSALVRPERC